MKLFAVLATFLLCTELSFGAKTSNKNSVKKSLRKMVSAEGCKTVTVTAEGDPWNAEALAAGAITTWAYPMYLKGTTTEVGEWEGYCVGLGTAVDAAGEQICTNLFGFEADGGLFGVEGDAGLVTGTSVYAAGETAGTIVVTGGSGSYQDASGSVTVTYADSKWYHAFSLCF